MLKFDHGILYRLSEARSFSKPKLGLLVRDLGDEYLGWEFISDDLPVLLLSCDSFYLPKTYVDQTAVCFSEYFLGPNGNPIEVLGDEYSINGINDFSDFEKKISSSPRIFQ